MNKQLICLLFAICAPWAASGAQCTGAETQLQSVSRALAAEDTKIADDILDALEHFYPDCAEISFDRGRSYELKGDAKSAEIVFYRYTVMEPDDAKGYAALARTYLEENRYERADTTSLQAMEMNSLDPSTLALRGQILGMQGHREEGIHLLEQACQIDPDNADAHFQLGTLYVMAKRRGDAAKEFEKTLAIIPGNASAWDYLALNLETLGQADQAEEAYRKGEAVNKPGIHYDGFLDYNYGRFLTKLYRLNEAKDHLDRAVKLAPNVRAVWYERAKVNLYLKDLPAARADAEKADSLPDPGGVILDLQVYTQLEEIYRRLGEKDLANKYADLSRNSPTTVEQTR